MYYNVLNATRSVIAIFNDLYFAKKKKKCFEKIRAISSKLASEGLVKRKLTIRHCSLSVSAKKSVLESLKLLKLSVYKYSLGVERKLFIHSQ